MGSLQDGWPNVGRCSEPANLCGEISRTDPESPNVYHLELIRPASDKEGALDELCTEQPIFKEEDFWVLHEFFKVSKR